MDTRNVTAQPLISICIPTNKSRDFLRRLLDSILEQTFKDFEIIVTDNSVDDNLYELLRQYADRLPILHVKNVPPVSMGENWNLGQERARGEWIKIMHDDDWFASPEALEAFALATKNPLQTTFIVGGYQSYNETTGIYKSMLVREREFKQLMTDPFRLVKENKIGPPSVIMVKNGLQARYDPRLKWRIDIDYYWALLRTEKAYYIPETLISYSYNVVQTTNECYNNRIVEIPEALILYSKYGTRLTRKPLLYDVWWRLMRNLEIRDVAELEAHASGYIVPDFFRRIVRFQQKFPLSIIKNGYFSKCLMLLSYIFNPAKS